MRGIDGWPKGSGTGMRDVGEIERDVAATKERLLELESEKKGAEEDARLPRESMIRRRYEVIQRMLEQLADLGESVGDGEGYALHIKGKTFEIDPTAGVQEV
jgi:hypothetical protein